MNEKYELTIRKMLKENTYFHHSKKSKYTFRYVYIFFKNMASILCTIRFKDYFISLFLFYSFSFLIKIIVITIISVYVCMMYVCDVCDVYVNVCYVYDMCEWEGCMYVCDVCVKDVSVCV